MTPLLRLRLVHRRNPLEGFALLKAMEITPEHVDDLVQLSLKVLTRQSTLMSTREAKAAIWLASSGADPKYIARAFMLA